MESNSNKPVASFRYRGLSANVFRNRGQNDSTFYKVSLQRTYRQNEEFKTTNNLGTDDLLPARELLALAWDAIREREANGHETDQGKE